MASVHIPLFLDGKLTANFRSKPVIDGSFRAEPKHYNQMMTTYESGLGSNGSSNKIILLNWQEDPILSDRTLRDAVSVISKEGIWDLLERGRSHAILMEKRGDFDTLQ